MPFPRETTSWARRVSDTLVELLDDDRISEIIGDDTHARLDAPHQLASPVGELRRSIGRLLSPSSRRPRQLSPEEKKKVAQGVYYGLSYRYGFLESLDNGNWTPWPNECGMVNCYSQSVINYLVARNAGLKPILTEFVGLQKEGSTLRAGHSLVVVDVGDDGSPEYWVIDQPMGMYGPTVIDDNTMVVENLAARQERTHRRDFRKERYGFILNIANDEEQIVAHIEQLRAHPEAVLFPGQRIAIPHIDSWQSEQALDAPWYLKFISDHSGETGGTLVSRIIMARPGIKSRGLEYRITLAPDGKIRDEKVIGYLCTGMVWADFTAPIPFIQFSLDDISKLVEGLTEIPLHERQLFEHSLMKESSSPSPSQRKRIEAARKSFDLMRDSEYGDIVTAITAVEALYQHEKGTKETYLNTSERERAITQLRTLHPMIGFYAKAAKVRGQNERTRQLLERRTSIATSSRLGLLQPHQREDPRTQAFLALQTEQERLAYILSHKPTYFTDAIDRLIFYDRRIKGKERNVVDIARTTFGVNYDVKLFSGYVRMWAEFLGHTAVTLPQLSLQEYKRKILDKITSVH